MQVYAYGIHQGEAQKTLCNSSSQTDSTSKDLHPACLILPLYQGPVARHGVYGAGELENGGRSRLAGTSKTFENVRELLRQRCFLHRQKTGKWMVSGHLRSLLVSLKNAALDQRPEHMLGCFKIGKR